MEPSPRLTLLQNSQALGGLHYSTSVVAIRAATHLGLAVGSGLVVQIEDDFWLVTARHVVAKARAPRLIGPWSVEALRMGEGGARLPVQHVEFDDAIWHLADDDDLAAARFPVDRLPVEHLVSAVPIERIGIARVNFAPEVTLTGRWGEPQDRNLIVTRRGMLTTMQRPNVHLEIGPGQYVEREVYLVDASIMPGMSGGAVFNDMQPPCVYGVISARQIAPRPAAFTGLPDGARMAAEAIWDAVGALNSGMVYVVPALRTVPFLLDVHQRGV